MLHSISTQATSSHTTHPFIEARAAHNRPLRGPQVQNAPSTPRSSPAPSLPAQPQVIHHSYSDANASNNQVNEPQRKIEVSQNPQNSFSTSSVVLATASFASACLLGYCVSGTSWTHLSQKCVEQLSSAYNHLEYFSLQVLQTLGVR